MHLRTLPLAAALLLAAACAPAAKPAPDIAAIKKAIEAADAAQVVAIGKGDAAGAAAGYADDALIFNPGQPVVKGKAAQQAMFAQMMAGATFSDLNLKMTDVVVSEAGDLAVEHGTYSWTITPKGGAAMADTGKFLVVWKKQADGGWKIIRDIINTDLAPKP
jgi:uncharacterized protein (TIGR02246 family)